MMGVL